MSQCPECGALYDGSVTCADRFDVLLALDHSRREPWGSRHGQAFAAFALQHPHRYPRSVDAAWDALYQIYCLGHQPAEVFAARRKTPDAPPRIKRARRPVRAFTVTIAHLDDFAAETYAAKLDVWCRSALAAWGAPISQPDER
jgi:hypothetical protein